MKWAYGITTIPARRYSYFPKTLESLRLAGFHRPTIFVDGPTGDYSEYDLPVVYRSEQIQAYGNWLLALMELWIRNPNADRYALFQDDFITYKNLKEYLDCYSMTAGEYWNLYTFLQNEVLHPSKKPGWLVSNQRGRGAVALVFGNDTVFKLLTSDFVVARLKNDRNSHRNIDGTVVTCLFNLKVRELVHYPTLVQHIGDCSSIGNRQWDHEKPQSFLGEDFDAKELIKNLPLPQGT